MKALLILLLGVSLVANIALFARRSASGAATANTQTTRADASAKGPIPVPEFSTDTWALATAGDPAATERFRQLGLPDSIIRALIVRQIDLRFRDREQALRAHERDAFWRRDFPYYTTRPTDPLAALDLRREKNAEKQRLLAGLPDPESVQSGTSDAFVPPAKREQLRLIREDYQALRQLYSAYDGVLLPQEREKLLYLETQERTDIAALLTPEELAEYDLRFSPTAQQLRFQLTAFDATEDEYKAIYALRRAYDEHHLPQSGQTVLYSSTPGPADAREKLAADLKTALGEERYAAYERSQDYEFRTIAAVAARLDLPPEKAVEAHTLKIALEQKMRAFRPAPGTPANAQRAAYFAALAEEAEAGFTAILGEKGYAAYKEYGQLPRRIRPPTTPPPPR